MVRQWQTLFYGKRYSNTVLEDRTNFAKLADAMGAKGYTVKTVAEFEKAMKEALKGEGAYLIDCQIEQDEKVWPMVAPGASIETCFDSEDGLNK
jgi:acetolactate synthase-1/2/3 large subunit